MDNIIEEFLQYDSAEISDALDSLNIEGALIDIKPVNDQSKICGYAFTVKYQKYLEKPKEFKNAANYIDQALPNSIIVIDNAGSNDITTWGNILTQVAIINKINGTVINGAARDIDYIKSVKYPLFTKNIFMRSGKNRVYLESVSCEITINNVKVKPNDIVFGDSNGVIIIPHEVAREVLQRAKNIKQTEEKIIQAIKDGAKLEDARKQHRYDQPWTQN